MLKNSTLKIAQAKTDISQVSLSFVSIFMRMPFSITFRKALAFVLDVFLSSKVNVGSIEKNEHLVFPIALQLVLHRMNMVKGLGQMPIQYSVDYGLLMCKPRKAMLTNGKRMKKNLSFVPCTCPRS